MSRHNKYTQTLKYHISVNIRSLGMIPRRMSTKNRSTFLRIGGQYPITNSSHKLLDGHQLFQLHHENALPRGRTAVSYAVGVDSTLAPPRRYRTTSRHSFWSVWDGAERSSSVVSPRIAALRRPWPRLLPASEMRCVRVCSSSLRLPGCAKSIF